MCLQVLSPQEISLQVLTPVTLMTLPYSSSPFDKRQSINQYQKDGKLMDTAT